MPDIENNEMENGEVDDNLIENEDGSVDILMGEDGEENEQEGEGEGSNDFQVNLAEVLDESTLTSLSLELLDLIEIDKESRQKRDEQYAEGLRRTGLGDDAPGGATFPGASKAVHPVLAEACVDYSSAMMKEIFPPDGPVRTHSNVTNDDPSFLERAENKRDYLNWQLVHQMPEYRANLEVLSTQQPLGGSQFLKIIYDEGRKRPVCEFIPIDRVYLPYSAASFDSAQRATISIPLTSYEYLKRVRSGMYRDLPDSAPAFMEDETESEKATDKIEGKEADAYNEDGLREIYEIYVYQDLEGDGDNPYVISIDTYSKKVLSIYRNWDEGDELREKLEWVVEWPFIPWRGAYGIGLGHLIGGLSAAATGALRALLDSAHINNFPGAIKLKGSGRGAGQNLAINPTEIVEIEGTATVDDIRKTIMGLPFNPPSTVLFQLLGFVVDAAKGVVSVADEKIADSTNQMPVGTALALIEQGSKVFSAIHSRQHVAQAKVLKILCRINAQNFNPESQLKQFGKVIVPQEDFLDSSNISPVSDPNIFSEAQRYAQIQGVLQISADPTVPWNKVAIYRRVLRIMHVENPNELLPEPPTPVSADPTNEIVAAMMGQQLKATPDMPHLEHIMEELQFIMDPIFGAANPSNMSPGFGTILADIHQHMIFLFKQIKDQSLQAAQQKLIGQMVGDVPNLNLQDPSVGALIQQQLSNPQVQNALRQESSQIYQNQVQHLQFLVQGLQQATEMVNQRTPPPPTPPEVQVQMQVAQMESQRRSKMDEATLQMKQQDQQARLQLEASRFQLDQMSAQFQQALEQKRVELNAELQQLGNQINLQKNREDNRQHQVTELAKNHEDNQTQLFMEQMRQEGLQNRAEMESQFKSMSERMDQMVRLAIEEANAERNKSTKEKE